MRFTKLLLNSTALTLINWLFFVLAFCWASILKDNILWWRDLHWYSWLTELEAIVLLRMIPAGSIWILWLLFSSLLTLVWFAARIGKARPVKIPVMPEDAAVQMPEEMNSEPIEKQVTFSETPPELREKIMRLQASLDKI